MRIRLSIIAALALPLVAVAQNRGASTPAQAAAAAPMRFDFSKDKAGAEPAQFLSVVGNWIVTEDSGRKVLLVDGREWKQGQVSGGLADKARTLYGARNEEFLDNVKAFAFYPIIVNKDIENFANGEITVKFKTVGGTLDQCSGILFNVKPNGDYLTIRFNGTEDNVGMWKVVKGVRTSVIRSQEPTPIAKGTWAELKVVTRGAHVQGYLNGKLLVETDWSEPISGKVGLWSKTDSMSEFDAFTVTRAIR